MAGLFGDMSLTDVPFGVPRGTYLCDLEVKGPFPNKNDDYVSELLGPRSFYTLTFTISDEDPEVGEDHGDTELSAIYLNFYSDCKTPFASLEGDDKKYFRDAVNFFKKIATSLGATEEQINTGNIDLDDFDGKRYYVGVYSDKMGQARANTSRINVYTPNSADEFESMSIFKQDPTEPVANDLADLT